jgi:hypothetical protein
MALVRFLGSLTFAIFLIGSLALILAVSTMLESAYGTPFVQKFFYRAGWFDVFLGLLAVNIFCSTLGRWPFKRKHTGFVITHIGILTLLAGSLLSRLFGVEGQIALYEKESQDSILQDGYELVVHDVKKHATRLVELKPHSGKKAQPLDTPGADIGVSINRVLESVEEDLVIGEGAAADPVNRAIRLTLQSEMAGFKQTFWLVEKSPFNPGAHELALGPAVIRLEEKKETSPEAAVKPEKAGLRIRDKRSGEVLWVDLVPPPAEGTPLGETGLRVSRLAYYPDARVEENALMSVSNEPRNPAVQLEIADASGRSEKHTLFALFPDFESIHGRSAGPPFDLSIELVVPGAERAARPSPPTLTFHPGTPWSYTFRSSKAEKSGEFSTGAASPAGWMDFTFTAEKLLERAQVSKKISETKKGAKGEVGVEILVSQAGQTAEPKWVVPGKPLKIKTAESEVLLAVAQRSSKVPFVLGLNDFRKVDYPGTRNAASYESDVFLRDHKENLTIEKTISMNKPLDYKGFRIFQSSFVQNPELGEASVFTVAKNPGITFIYSGACVLFTGVFLLFFVKPLSSLKTRADA